MNELLNGHGDYCVLDSEVAESELSRLHSASQAVATRRVDRKGEQRRGGRIGSCILFCFPVIGRGVGLITESAEAIMVKVGQLFATFAGRRDLMGLSSSWDDGDRWDMYAANRSSDFSSTCSTPWHQASFSMSPSPQTDTSMVNVWQVDGEENAHLFEDSDDDHCKARAKKGIPLCVAPHQTEGKNASGDSYVDFITGTKKKEGRGAWRFSRLGKTRGRK